MFSEVLRIKPVLDTATATQMETSLTKRFQRIATGFGRGLKNVLKISAFGIGLALLQKLLSPLSEMEDRIKKLLGEGHDLSELADKLDTNEGFLRLAQGVAASVGVKPDELKGLLESFSKSVGAARDEAKSPEGIHSPGATVVSEFAGFKDLLQSFVGFIGSLKSSSPELRARQEEAVFGHEQFGAVKKFINSDFSEQGRKIGAPDVFELQKASEKAAGLNALQNQLEAGNDLKNFVKETSKLNDSIIQQLAAEKQREEQFAIDRFDNIQALIKGSQSVEDIKELVEQNLDNLLTLTGFIKPITGALLSISQILNSVTSSRWFRQITKEPQ